MPDLSFLKDHPELAKNIRLEISGSDVMDLVESFKSKIPEVWLTPDELKERLKVSLDTLHNWDDSGILKPVKFGRLKRYRESDIENMGK